jgi:threonyl-tRNA synthetase
MLVVGDRELNELVPSVSVRSRSGGDLGPQSVDDFVHMAKAEIVSKGMSGGEGLAAAS